MLTRKKAIKEKCLDCCGGQKLEIRKRQITKCPLWEYRTGSHTPLETQEKAEKSVPGGTCE